MSFDAFLKYMFIYELLCNLYNGYYVRKMPE